MPDTLRAMLRRFGLLRDGDEPATGSAADRPLIDAQQDDQLAGDQERMLQSLFHFRDTLAREVMTPRRDIIALPVTASLAETLALVTEEGHSRIPVYRDSVDDIVGILLLKDLLGFVTRQPAPPAETFALTAFMREPYFVPDTKPIGELLAELRRRSVHMAILLDEFGGTEGLITLEDMIEEIVGDIYDEHDAPEETEFALTPTGEVIMGGGASIFEANERCGLTLPEADFDTVGGFVFGELGRVPVAGDVVSLGDAGALHVDAVEDRRILRVRLVRADQAGSNGDGGAAEAAPGGAV